MEHLGTIVVVVAIVFILAEKVADFLLGGRR